MSHVHRPVPAVRRGLPVRAQPPRLRLRRLWQIHYAAGQVLARRWDAGKPRARLSTGPAQAMGDKHRLAVVHVVPRVPAAPDLFVIWILVATSADHIFFVVRLCPLVLLKIYPDRHYRKSALARPAACRP